MKELLREYLLDHWFARYVLRTLLVLYVLLVLFALIAGGSLIFAPGRAGYEDTSDILKLTTSDGVQISAVYLPNPQAKYTILYSHGNGDDLGKDGGVEETLRDEGFAVFAYDYHGYGTSQGEASELNTYRDIDAAYAYLTETLNVPPSRIILYGHSLGGGPAIDLAARKPVAGLVTQSTFTTPYRVVTRIPLIPFDKYHNITKIPQVRCPVLIMHGRADQVIPFHHGEQLYAAARAPKRYFWVDGAGHNDLLAVAGSQHEQVMQNFVDLIDVQ